eukprot:3619942-Rhodomonas_salina.1
MSVPEVAYAPRSHHTATLPVQFVPGMLLFVYCPAVLGLLLISIAVLSPTDPVVMETEGGKEGGREGEDEGEVLVPPSVRTAGMVLRACYARSGTVVACSTLRCPVLNAACGTGRVYGEDQSVPGRGTTADGLHRRKHARYYSVPPTPIFLSTPPYLLQLSFCNRRAHIILCPMPWHYGLASY